MTCQYNITKQDIDMILPQNYILAAKPHVSMLEVHLFLSIALSNLYNIATTDFFYTHTF